MFQKMLIAAWLLSTAACASQVSSEGEELARRDASGKTDEAAATPLAALVGALDEHVGFDKSRVDSHCWTGNGPDDLRFTLLTLPDRREAAMLISPVARVAGSRLVITDRYEADIWRQSAGVTFRLGEATYNYTNSFDEGWLILPDERVIELRCLDPETEL